MIEFIVKKGAEVNATSTDLWTALHIAAQNGRDQNVEKLIQMGANVNATDSIGQTPLYIATRFGNPVALIEYNIISLNFDYLYFL